MIEPAVSVIMSVRDGMPWLREAVGSLLGQTFRGWELIVVDDASTDGTALYLERLSDPRVRTLRRDEPLGLTRNLNAALREARAPLVARLDADDFAESARLARQVAALHARPELALVGSQARVVDAQGHDRGDVLLPLETAGLSWARYFQNPLVHSAVMFRASVVRDELGGYDESWAVGQDYELWTRLLARGFEAANLPERLVRWRRSEGSVTSRRAKEGADAVRRVLVRELAALLPARVWSEPELALLLGYRSTLKPEQLAPFFSLREEISAAWSAQHPAWADAPDVHRARALQHAFLAYNLPPHSRAAAWREWRTALSAWPGVRAELPWLRMAARLALGK
jgi:glycosyltransferase involved in cell wall biosynthesis